MNFAVMLLYLALNLVIAHLHRPEVCEIGQLRQRQVRALEETAFAHADHHSAVLRRTTSYHTVRHSRVDMLLHQRVTSWACHLLLRGCDLLATACNPLPSVSPESTRAA